MCCARIPHCTRHSPHSPVWTRFRSCRGRSSDPKARGLAWTRSRILHGGHNSSGWKSTSSGASGTARSKFCCGVHVRMAHVHSQPAHGSRATEIVPIKDCDEDCSNALIAVVVFTLIQDHPRQQLRVTQVYHVLKFPARSTTSRRFYFHQRFLAMNSRLGYE